MRELIEDLWPGADAQAAAEEAAGLSMIDVPRGKYIGRHVGDPPKSEAEHFHEVPGVRRLDRCRDLGQVFEHEGPLSHPAQDKPQ